MKLGLTLVLSPAVPRILSLSQMAQLIVNVARIMRNSDGRFTWVHLEGALTEASRLAHDTALINERTILDKVLFRGQRMMGLCNNAAQVLVTWTQLLPNARGVDQKQLRRGVKALERVRKANSLPHGSLGGGAGSRSASNYQSQRANTGRATGGRYPAGGAYTPPPRGPSAFGSAVVAPPLMLPMQGGQGRGRSRSRTGNPGGQS